MNGTLWALIGGAIFTVLVALGAFRAGERSSELDCQAEKNTALDKIIVKQQVLIKEVPKIVTEYVQTTTTVENTYHETITKVPSVFDPSCTMPPWWGELFVAAANGQSFDPSRTVGKVPGSYGCTETATATLKDLSAGSQNSAQLVGVLKWAQVIGDSKHDTRK